MEPFLGEIRPFPSTFAPYGWLYCNGQILNISEYEALFQLIGATYGGNGSTTFALPDLRGRVAVGQGQLTGGAYYNLGQKDGTETVTLTANQLPAHTHTVAASSAVGTTTVPTGGTFATPAVPRGGVLYSSAAPSVSLAQTEVAIVGGTEAHSNLAPGMSMRAIICLQGIFPQRP